MVKQAPKSRRVIRAGAEVKPCGKILQVDSVNLKTIAHLAAGSVVTGVLVNVDAGDRPGLSKGITGQQDGLTCGLAGRSDGVLHHIKLHCIGAVFSLGRIGQKIMRNLTGIAVPAASQ